MKTKIVSQLLVTLSLLFLLPACSLLQNLYRDQPEDQKTAEAILVCETIMSGFERQMSSMPLYKTNWLGQCQKIEDNALIKSNWNVYTDRVCENRLSFYKSDLHEFCKYEVVRSTESSERLGNPKLWSHIEEGATPRQTPWTLPIATTLQLGAFNQTTHHQPFLKKVEYRQVNDCSLAMWILKKDVTAKNLKPLIFIHGGAWEFRGAGASVGIKVPAPNFTEKDYIIFAPFYRLLSHDDGPAECQGVTIKEIIDDIEFALNWVFDNGSDYGAQANVEKISIGGQSAGGHLSAYMATHHPEKIERALLLYPVTDLSFFVNNIYTGLFKDGFALGKSTLPYFSGVPVGSHITPESPYIQENSFPEIIKNTAKDYPPMFIIQGVKDSMSPIEMSTRLCQGLAGEALSDKAYTGESLTRECGQKSKLNVICGKNPLTGECEANHMLDLKCLGLGIIPAICPPGSMSGQTEVVNALTEVYTDFF